MNSNSKNNINLYYEKMGIGTPLIMIHGNGENHEIFKEAIEILKKKFTVYAIDLRGHGKSSPVNEYHYLEMANDIYEFIKLKQIEKPIFYGFSDGGILGLLLASQYPQLFDSLIISGANLNPRGLKKRWYYLFQILYFFHKDPKFKMMLTEPNISVKELNKISVKTLVLAGKKDMIAQEHTTFIADSIKNSKLKILDAEGHGSYIVHSKKIAYEIFNFISL